MASPGVLTDRAEDCLFTRDESGEVVFHYFQPFDRNTGEYDEFYGRFPKVAHEQGAESLAREMSCNISGYNCTLEIKRIQKLFHIFFSSLNRGVSLTRATLDGFL